MRLFTCFLSLCMLPIAVGAQTGYSLSWQKGSEIKATPSKVLLAKDGSIMVAGCTQADSTGFTDGWLAQFDAKGKMLWEKRYGMEKGSENFTALVQTRDGGFALTGNTTGRGAGKHDLWVAKVDAKGKMLWDTAYGGKKEDYGTDIIETAQGGLAVAGYTDSKGRGESDYWLLKLDRSGNRKWDAVDGGGKADMAYSLVETGDAGFLVAGYSIAAYGYGGKDVFLVRFDSTGQKKWDKIKGGPQDDVAHKIMKTKDGNFTIFATNNSKKDYTNGWFLKLSDNGKKWVGEGNFPTGRLCMHTPLECRAVTETADGSFLAVGKGFVYEKEDDLLLVRLTPEGKEENFWTQGGTRNDEGISIVESSDKSVYVAGQVDGKGFILLKYVPKEEGK